MSFMSSQPLDQGMSRKRNNGSKKRQGRMIILLKRMARMTKLLMTPYVQLSLNASLTLLTWYNRTLMQCTLVLLPHTIRDDNSPPYVGVPHPGHYQLVQLALNHGKHVLCEKPFTMNAKEALVLMELAKEKKLFLMEAMWTRFLPIAKYISDLVKGGTLGDVRIV
jgi:hypothetical protein